MRLIVRGGTLVTPGWQAEGDVLCVDGRIAGLLSRDERVAADEELDASGKLVFPGFIDPHVHSRDPGLTEKEDFAHSTLSAIVGGVTTVLEMPNAVPPVRDAETFRARAAEHEQVAAADFGLWGVTLGRANLDGLAGMYAEGAVACKLFWGYALRRDTQAIVYNFGDQPPENLLLPPENGEVLEIFREIARLGWLLAAHCEDRHILAGATEAIGHPIETYEDFLASRPPLAEAASIAVGVEMSRATGAAFHVVHMSSAEGAEIVRHAQGQGVRITSETCPQYLTLTAADYDAVGPLMKVYPPIREQHHQDALWQAVNDGTICSIGSDHAPHTLEEKAQGFTTQPAGVVGVETLAPLLLDEMSRGRISPQRVAAVLSEGTARLYGLYPRKGALVAGADADLAVVDPTATYTIRNEDLHSKHPLSPWNGQTVTGRVTATVLRGEIAARDGEPVGERRGRLVRARHAAGELREAA